MIITNVILIWALNFINLGNYKSFSNFDNYIRPIKISKNKVFVFDKENVHTIKTDSATTIAKFKLPYTPANTPISKDGVLYYSSEKGLLVAYSIKETKILWKKQLETTNYRQTTIYNDILITYTNINQVEAFDTLTGKQIWSYTKDLSKKIILNSDLKPLIYKNFVILGINNYLTILNPLTGVTILEKAMPIDSKEIINYTKIFKNNILISTNKGKLLYLSLNGNLIWKYSTDYFVFETRENNIILATKTKLIILNTNGIKFSEHQIGQAFPYDIKVINGAVVIATSIGVKFWNLLTNKIFYTYKNNTGIKHIFIDNNTLITLSNKGIYYAFKIVFSNKI